MRNLGQMQGESRTGFHSPVFHMQILKQCPSCREFSAVCSIICKIRYFWVLFRIGSSARTDEGVNWVLCYREGNSQVWNGSEQGDTRWRCFRGGESVHEGGLAGARVRRRLS